MCSHLAQVGVGILMKYTVCIYVLSYVFGQLLFWSFCDVYHILTCTMSCKLNQTKLKWNKCMTVCNILSCSYFMATRTEVSLSRTYHQCNSLNSKVKTRWHASLLKWMTLNWVNQAELFYNNQFLISCRVHQINLWGKGKGWSLIWACVTGLFVKCKRNKGDGI